MQLTESHLLSLFATVIAVLFISIYSSFKIKSAEAFSLGGRSAGTALVSGTIAGTIIGGAATVGTAQLAFTSGLSAWWFTLGSGIGFIIMGCFYARPLRNTGLETISQYFVQNYGKAVGPITTVISSVGIFFSIVASSLSGINLISAVFGLSSTQAGMIIVLLVAAYVFLGGMRGAGLSGIFKVAIIYVTLLAAGTTAFTSLKTIPDIERLLPAQQWFSLAGSGVGGGLGRLFSLIVGIICTQTYVQAIYSARDSQTAIVGTFTAAIITIPIGLPSVAVGMFMRVNHPEIMPINALPMFLLNYLPSWLGGIGIAGILISVVGSIAGLVLGIGTMASRDILHGWLGVNNNRKLLWVNRGTIILVTTGAVFLAQLNLRSLVLEWNFLSMTLRGAGVFLPLTLAVFWPGKLPARWAAASMVISTAIGVLCSFQLFLRINPLFPGIAASIVIVFMGMGSSKYTSLIRIIKTAIKTG